MQTQVTNLQHEAEQASVRESKSTVECRELRQRVSALQDECLKARASLEQREQDIERLREQLEFSNDSIRLKQQEDQLRQPYIEQIRELEQEVRSLS